MIVRRKHPLQPEVPVFVPTRFHREDGAWKPLLADEAFFYQEVEAAGTCLEYVLCEWSHIARSGRLLRALCEHPEFDFEADGIDANMIREHARKLAEHIELVSEDLRRLLDEPDDDDTIEIHGEQLQVDEITGAVPSLQALEAPLREQAQDLSTPDKLYPHLVAVSLPLAEKMSGGPVGQQGFTDALIWLVKQTSGRRTIDESDDDACIPTIDEAENGERSAMVDEPSQEEPDQGGTQ